jgi:hypothetical protein
VNRYEATKVFCTLVEKLPNVADRIDSFYRSRREKGR